MRTTFRFAILTSFLLILNSCGSTATKTYNSNSEDLETLPYGDNTNPLEASPSTYDTIAIAFDNIGNEESVKRLLDAVLLDCNMAVDRDNVMHLANGLVGMRKQSNVGVTEMDILKHMYQRGTSKDLVTRLATSATILEQTK